MPGLVSAGGKRPVWKGRLVYTAIMMKTIRVGSRLLDLQRPVVMAIINVTPDSFFAGSRTPEVRAVRERVHKAVAEGASIIDVGGYSSRSGAADVPPAEELRRVSLAVEVIRNEYPEMAVSVDTFRASVAEGVISRFGPCIVNDISAGELDADIMGVAARYGVPYIAMHMRGTPADMQGRTVYGDITREVVEYLAGRLEAARRAGIRDVVLDPGFGFAKTTAQNYELLAGMGGIAELGCPVLAGVSRKSMIYKVLGVTPDDSLNGTTAMLLRPQRLCGSLISTGNMDGYRMIEAADVHKSYGSLEVLKGVSLTVCRGEVVCIVGASGAGKTTLLQILGTLSAADSGRIRIDGIPVERLSDRELSDFRNRRIGFVFQFHHLLPEFTAFENVCMPGYIGRRDRVEVEKQARELLLMLGLGSRGHHKPAELSGGEQQRVAIARALVNSPSVLLADEPSGNLDSKNREEIHRLFFELRDRLGQTVVIVTHDDGLAEMSDRKIVMSDGLIIA